MPEKDLEELRQLFIQIDENGNGKIAIDEFTKSLTLYGVNYTPEETKEMLRQLDTNDNGYIDYTEFLAGCMRSKIYLKEDHLKNAFSYFDKVIFFL